MTASGACAAMGAGSGRPFMPSRLRVGWIRAPHAVVERLTRLKIAADMGTSLLSQHLAARLLPGTSTPGAAPGWSARRASSCDGSAAQTVSRPSITVTARPASPTRSPHAST